MRQPRRDASFRGAPKGTSSTMVSQGCMREDKKAAQPATWPRPGKQPMPSTALCLPLFAYLFAPSSPSRHKRGLPANIQRRLGAFAWGKSNGGMGLGQDHWKKASPGPGRFPDDASRNAKPDCALESAHREFRKIGCLGTGRAKGRYGGRSRISQRWNG